MNSKNILIGIIVLIVGAGIGYYCAFMQPTTQDTWFKAGATFSPRVELEFTNKDREEWRKIAKWPEQCEEDFAIGSDEGMGGLALFTYAPNESILRVTCGVYAYQLNMLFFHVTAKGAEKIIRPLSLSTYDIEHKKVVAREYEYEDDIAGSVLGFDTFNPKEKNLTIFLKDRGLGDCGTRETFAVGPELTLQKVEYMSCEDADEFHLQNPDATEMAPWPVVYEQK